MVRMEHGALREQVGLIMAASTRRRGMRELSAKRAAAGVKARAAEVVGAVSGRWDAMAPAEAAGALEVAALTAELVASRAAPALRSSV